MMSIRCSTQRSTASKQLSRTVMPDLAFAHVEGSDRRAKASACPSTRQGRVRVVRVRDSACCVRTRATEGLEPGDAMVQDFDVTDRMISHYRVTGLLGAGGMGEVHAAEDTRLERRVALKLIPADTADDPRRRQRLLSEARAASALNHANVCTIYEVGETDDGRWFIAMELIEGMTLDQRSRNAPLELNEIPAIGRQIADALDAAHAKGIAELMIDLRRLERGSETTDPISGDPKVTGADRLRFRALVGATLVLALILSGWFIWHSRNATTRTGRDTFRLAVLPLDNISPDPGDAYFADGTTDELIGTLSKIGDLAVIARTSVMPYKNAGESIAQIGRELRVDTILD